MGTILLLDGFPRTLSQAYMKVPNLSIDTIIHVKVPLEICYDKLLGRRYCPLCNNDFNVCSIQKYGYTMLKRVPGNCSVDKCNMDQGTWIKRKDDKNKIILKRLKEYNSVEKQLIRYYQKNNEVLEFTPYRGVEDLQNMFNIVRERVEKWEES